jgi:hypothetical protein
VERRLGESVGERKWRVNPVTVCHARSTLMSARN